jgi:hypothetical protein
MICAAEVGVGWGKIVEALVIARMVVMSHEVRDLTFEIADSSRIRFLSV